MGLHSRLPKKKMSKCWRKLWRQKREEDRRWMKLEKCEWGHEVVSPSGSLKSTDGRKKVGQEMMYQIISCEDEHVCCVRLLSNVTVTRHHMTQLFSNVLIIAQKIAFICCNSSTSSYRILCWPNVWLRLSPQSGSLFCGALPADRFTAWLAVKRCQDWQRNCSGHSVIPCWKSAPPVSRQTVIDHAKTVFERPNTLHPASQILGAAAHRFAVQGETAITRVETPTLRFGTGVW